jgi:hypothetical protein
VSVREDCKWRSPKLNSALWRGSASWSPELDGAVSRVEEIEGAFADLEIAGSKGLILDTSQLIAGRPVYTTAGGPMAYGIISTCVDGDWQWTLRRCHRTEAWDALEPCRRERTDLSVTDAWIIKPAIGYYTPHRGDNENGSIRSLLEHYARCRTLYPDAVTRPHWDNDPLLFLCVRRGPAPVQRPVATKQHKLIKSDVVSAVRQTGLLWFDMSLAQSRTPIVGLHSSR